jgi:hypothetical protein
MFTAFSRQQCKLIGLVGLFVLLNAAALFAQGPGTGFSFQGKLGDANSPVNGALDMQFKLFDSADPNNSNQVGTTITLNNPLVEVINGVFTVQLDFGAASLPGADRFLEIGIRKSSSDPYTLLSPRTKIASSPYAVRSLNATGADALSPACNACIQNSQINSLDASKLTGTIPSSTISASSVPAGSGNYIQNASGQQASSNFNIDGTGTANIINAATQYNLGGSRVLSQSGVNNLFAGSNAGLHITTGPNNSFFGVNAGQATTTGGRNSFFGNGSGVSNASGSGNAFFGFLAGSNSLGSNNTMLGASTNVGTTGLINSTAIGANAFVTQNNSLVLGSINGVNGATADTNVGIGTTGPSARLHVAGNALVTGNLTVNGNLIATIPGGSTSYIQNQNAAAQAANFNVSGNGIIGSKAGIGLTIPNTRLDVVDTAAQIRFGNSASDSGGYLFSGAASQAIVAGGAKWNGSAWVAKSTAASLVESRNGTINFFNDSGLTAGSTFSPTQRMRITPAGDVGIGTSAPAAALDVRGDIKLGPNGEFFDIASDEKLRMVRGAVNSFGNVLKGAGFTVTHAATGVYEIDFSSSFSEEPIITVTPRQFDSSKFACFATVDDPFSFGKTVRIQIWSHTGVSVDADFYFIAIGSR